MTFAFSKIVILRHGEGPGAPDVDDDAGPDLSVRGYCRVAALAPALPSTLGRPDFIVATAQSADSNRPVQTVTPLCNALGVDIDGKHADKDFQQVANDLHNNPRYAGKLIVICWHHGKIPYLTAALGAVSPVAPWPSTVFDRYRVLTPSADGTLQARHQPRMLLYGDNAL